jgi:DNA-binding response OmpR family regulator
MGPRMAKSPEKTTVLVADDDVEILAIVGRVLRRMGLNVLEAADGDEAMSLVLQHHPKLLVLDVMMPGQSGWEVCRSVRETESLKDTRILMLTGIGERLNELTSPLYGADAYLDKPFEIETLDRKVRELLDTPT